MNKSEVRIRGPVGMSSAGRDAGKTPWQDAARRIFVRRLRAFLVFLVTLLLAFAGPLWSWVTFALDSEIFSYVLLIPGVSLYLVWLRRKTIPIRVSYNPYLTLAVLTPAVVALLGCVMVLTGHWEVAPVDFISLSTAAFVFLLVGGVVAFFGAEIARAIVFPLVFLVTMVPLPLEWTTAIEVFLQHTSADMSHWLFKITGTPVYREGLYFQLPGIIIQVAQECSGIRSSLVLFIASLLAGNLLLQTTWRRIALAIFVIPLAILRNGIRILTISLLCVHIGPEMIHSAIHKRGGPLFFALSLIPFLLVLLFLRRTERKALPEEKPGGVGRGE